MYPELISSPVHISSYPALMLLGFFFAYLLARRRARHAGIEPRHIDNLVLILLVVGPFGARLFSRLFELHLPLWEALKVTKGGGLVFYGGFILSAAAAMTYALARKLPLIKFCDVAAPAAALGLAFGRIGCFLGGCCWGDVCVAPQVVQQIHDPRSAYQIYTVPAISPAGFPLAVTFPKHSEIFIQHQKLGLISADAPRSLPVHPAQLYESALAFVLCWLLARWKNATPGQVSAGLLLGYAVIRFAIEYVRADNSPVYWGMTLSQVISIFMALICFGWLYARKTGLARTDLVTPATAVS